MWGAVDLNGERRVKAPACGVEKLSAPATENLSRIQTEDRALSAEFHGFMVRYLAETVVNGNKSIHALAS